MNTAAPGKKKSGFAVHDFEPGLDTSTKKPGYSRDADVAFADVNPSGYVALPIPGSRVPECIRDKADCQRVIRHIFENEKPVAPLLHASLALTATGVLKRACTVVYRALEPDVKATRAQSVDSAVINGLLVRARAWPDRPGCMREFIRSSEGKGARANARL